MDSKTAVGGFTAHLDTFEEKTITSAIGSSVLALSLPPAVDVLRFPGVVTPRSRQIIGSAGFTNFFRIQRPGN
jgi:hypothetical protein